MKRFIIIFTLLLSTQFAIADSPKKVIEAILKAESNVNDYDKNYTEAYKAFNSIPAKIKINQFDKEDGLYLLAETLYKTHVDNDEGIYYAYIKFCKNYNDIAYHKDLKNLEKSCKKSLKDLQKMIEDRSCDWLLKNGTDEQFATYIDYARATNHTNLVYLEYEYATRSENIEVCRSFITTYPQSPYLANVQRQFEGLCYKEAMNSNDEAVLVNFIKEHPKHYGVEDVKNRYNEMRFTRVYESNNLNSMKCFIKDTPDYRDIPKLKQRMADIEYPTLGNNEASLRAFKEYYTGVTQIELIDKRLEAYDIINSGDITAIIKYIRKNGYNEFYPQFMKSLYNKHGYYILTPDITKTIYIRVVNREGKAGYLDSNGNEIIPFNYDSLAIPTFFDDVYSNTMIMEFTHQRPYAAVCVNGKWGVIDEHGNYILKPQFVDIRFDDNRIFGCTRKNNDIEFNVNKYDKNGVLLQSSELVYRRLVDFQYDNNVDATSQPNTRRVTYITPKYGYLKREKEVISTQAKRHPVIERDFIGVTDNIAVGKIVENDITTRYFINLDSINTSSHIKECIYEEIGMISCGRIAVKLDGKVGFLNDNLEVVIAPQYNHSSVLPQFTCGVAAVERADGTFALIDVNNNPINNTKYYRLKHFGQLGRSSVPGIFLETERIDNKLRYRLIDASGDVVTPWINSEPVVIGNCAFARNKRDALEVYRFYENVDTEPSDVSVPTTPNSSNTPITTSNTTPNAPITIDAPTPTAEHKSETDAEEEVLISCETMPSFRGGDLTTFRNWVQSNVKYPHIALENGIQGNVVIKFVVEKDGRIDMVQIEQSPDQSLSDATIQAIKNSPLWSPGLQNNKPVRITHTIIVSFKIQQ